jgi:hypothetical protein
MISWHLILNLLFGQPEHPPIKNLRLLEEALLPSRGLPMGNLIIGKQGSGKTSLAAKYLLDYCKAFPERPNFLLDWSGSITDTLLKLIMQEPADSREALLERVVYDELGHPDYVVPLPEFSPEYGLSYEEQVHRVKENWTRLAEFLVEGATVLGGIAYKVVAPEIMRLLIGIDEQAPWQVTEFGRFIENREQIAKAFRKKEANIPQRTREVLTQRFMNVKEWERELRTYTLTEILSAIESPAAKARLGYERPGWTAKKAIRTGQIVMVNGGNLINQKTVQHYLFTQVYSMIMAEINQRRPDNPHDLPICIVLDEVYSLLKIQGMAEEIGMISPLYRSRKVQLFVIIQALWQLDEKLAQQIWSLGNVVSFGVENVHEATEVAKQLIAYEPTLVKQPAQTERQNPITEPEHGQYTLYANWIQGLKNRQCVVRQYLSESQRDPYLRFIRRTEELPHKPLPTPLAEVKEMLLRKHGVPIQDALQVLENRTLAKTNTPSV